MTDKEKLELLLNNVFSDISFTKIQTLENGSFHLIDRTSEMWIRIEDNVAQIAFGKIFNLFSNELNFQTYPELILWSETFKFLNLQGIALIFMNLNFK